MFYKKISEHFTRWGKKAQKLPGRNEEIKQSVLNSLQPIHEPIREKKPFAFRWIVLTTVPALALFMMFNFWRYSNIESMSAPESAGFYAAEKTDQTASYGGDAMMGLSVEKTGLSKATSFVERIADKISMPASEPLMIAPPDYYYNGSGDITDTREYLKTNFGLNIKTRQVDKMYTRLKTIVRGYDGRIDNSNLTEKYASISFVLPKSTYESFVEEVTEIFPKKFITIHENSNNLLGQKQNIENQTEYASTTLENLKAERADNIKKYDEKYASLNKETSRLQRVMENLVEQRKTVSSTETEALKKIDDQLSYTRQIHNNAMSDLMRAMTQHEKDLENFDNQIKKTENNLVELDKQDTNLINNVETVNGTITLQWISLFNIVNLYVPFTKILIIFFVGIILFYLLFGRKSKEIYLP
ncbi:MAG: hypothetical protein Q7J14_01450 [Candidatus Magasanikbacteria bacterium]|nr:hypothetical protein [Candidatus Magasanikbacteria bacterium]